MKKWSKYEEEQLIEMLKNGKRYEEISIVLNRTKRSIREKSRKLGYLYSEYKIKEKETECLNCSKIFNVSANNKRELNRKFCSQSCSTSYNNKQREPEIYKKLSKKLSKREKDLYCLNCNKKLNLRQHKYCSNNCQNNYQYKEYIKKWKNNEVDGMSGNQGISTHIRKYLFEKYNNKCSKCGWNEINLKTGKIPLNVEHIDGNFENNKEENLDLLCPNCHSLTETYGNLNKGNGRKYRRRDRF